MNPNQYSATSAHSTLNQQKNHRLYQHLLESNYLNDHIYQPLNYHADNAASIKFYNPTPFHPATHPSYDKQDDLPKSTNNSAPQKISDMNSSKNHKNNQSVQSQLASPSFFSNYSIIEMQNQSCSTLNLYSMGPNPLDHDLSMASNGFTLKQTNNGGKIFGNTAQELNQHDNNNFAIQNYSGISSPKQPDISIISIEDKMQDRLAQQNLRNTQPNHNPHSHIQNSQHSSKLDHNFMLKQGNDNKYSHSIEEDGSSSLRIAANKIFVVSNRVNYKPKTDSPPLQSYNHSNKNQNAIIDVPHKIASNQKQQQSYQEVESPIKRLRCFGNNNIVPNQSDQNSLPFTSPDLQQQKSQSQTPKSYLKNQLTQFKKQIRSNTIQHTQRQSSIHKKQHIKKEKLNNPSQSNQIKLFQIESKQPQQQKQQNHGPIICVKSVVNVCCGFNQSQNSHVNKVCFKSSSKRQGFKQKNQEASGWPFLGQVGSVDLTNAPSYLKTKLPNYKITPLNSLRNRSDSVSSQKDKKGIKLTNFHSIYTHKKQQNH